MPVVVVCLQIVVLIQIPPLWFNRQAAQTREQMGWVDKSAEETKGGGKSESGGVRSGQETT